MKQKLIYSLLSDLLHVLINAAQLAKVRRICALESSSFLSVHFHYLFMQCPPGIDFTFQLVEIYNNLRKDNKEFEIIYVSSDENKEDWKAYSALMPWISLPYEDARTENLQTLFQVDHSGTGSQLDAF